MTSYKPLPGSLQEQYLKAAGTIGNLREANAALHAALRDLLEDVRMSEGMGLKVSPASKNKALAAMALSDALITRQP